VWAQQRQVRWTSDVGDPPLANATLNTTSVVEAHRRMVAAAACGGGAGGQPICDEYGFLLPEEAGGERQRWRVAATHADCLAARDLPQWAGLLDGSGDCRTPASWRQITALVNEHGVPAVLRRRVWPLLCGADRRAAQPGKQLGLCLVTLNLI
jgi:hypothetical protein